jgi:hypothetical protein
MTISCEVKLKTYWRSSIYLIYMYAFSMAEPLFPIGPLLWKALRESRAAGCTTSEEFNAALPPLACGSPALLGSLLGVSMFSKPRVWRRAPLTEIKTDFCGEESVQFRYFHLPQLRVGRCAIQHTNLSQNTRHDHRKENHKIFSPKIQKSRQIF